MPSGCTASCVSPSTLTTISRDLWPRLRSLTRADVERVSDRYLTPPEIGAMMRRHGALIEHYDELIKARGEGRVLY